ncbi:MAG: hypothetical protein K6360_05465 [Deltaproteobacteria bacterium]
MKRLPEASVAHESTGRIRLRIPERRYDPGYFADIEKAFSNIDMVTKVRANPTTASVLIMHRSTPGQISQAAETLGLFTIVRQPSKHTRPLSQRIKDGYRTLNSAVTAGTNGQIDIPTAAFLALAGWGAYQILQGRVAGPAWYTALWYGMNLLLKGGESTK